MLKDSFLNTLGNVIFYGFQWLITIVIANVLGLEDAGVYSLSVSFANMFAFIANYGIRSYQLSDSKNEFSQNDYLSTRIVLIAVSSFVFLIAIVLSSMETYTKMCAISYFVFQICTVVYEHFMAILQKDNSYKTIFISFSLKGLLPFTAFCISAIYTKNLLLSTILMTLVYMATLFYDARMTNCEKFKFRKSKMLLIIKKCFPLMALSVISTCLIYLTKNEIHNNYNSIMLGGYTSITMIVTVISTFIPALFSTFIFHFSEKYDYYSLKNGYRKMLILCLITSAFTMMICHFILPLLYTLMYGEKIREYLYLTDTAALLAIIMVFISLNQTIMISRKDNKYILGIYLFAFSLFLLIYKNAIEVYGLLGANYGLIVVYAVIFLSETIFIACCISKDKKKHVYNSR